MAKMNQSEHRFSHYACELLERIMLEDCWFTAVDTGTQTVKETPEARFSWENHRRWMGIKPSHLDLYIYQRQTGIYVQFELKVGDNKLTTGQETTMQLLENRGIPTGCFWNILDLYEAVVKAGFNLHRNAKNIAVEVNERHPAAEREFKLKSGVVKKRAPSKPRQAKPSSAAKRVYDRARASGIMT
jgi:hypothetical protein